VTSRLNVIYSRILRICSILDTSLESTSPHRSLQCSARQQGPRASNPSA
jgi:hypothetical protein